MVRKFKSRVPLVRAFSEINFAIGFIEKWNEERQTVDSRIVSKALLPRLEIAQKKISEVL